MEKIFPVLGVMVCMSAISYFLNSCTRHWESSNTHNLLCWVFSILNALFVFCSAPVGILIHLYVSRAEKICEEENSKKVSDAYALMSRKTGELEEEIKNLKEQIWDERFEKHMEDYNSGKLSGFQSGFREGFFACYDLTDFPIREKWNMLRREWDKVDIDSHLVSSASDDTDD